MRFAPPFRLKLPRRARPSAPKARNLQQNLKKKLATLLFTAVNVARFLGVDPEIALKKANSKFKQRFTSMESAALKEGKRFADLPRARMEELWNESKAK